MLCGVVKQLVIDTHTYQKEISQSTVTFEPFRVTEVSGKWPMFENVCSSSGFCQLALLVHRILQIYMFKHPSMHLKTIKNKNKQIASVFILFGCDKCETEVYRPPVYTVVGPLFWSDYIAQSVFTFTYCRKCDLDQCKTDSKGYEKFAIF